MGFLKKFAENLRDARKASGMTQRELAQKIGMTSNCISQYECAKRMPSLDIVSIMSHVLGISLDDLIPYVEYKEQVDENQTSIFDVIGE